MTADSSTADGADVAIIGLAGRFPGAHDIEQFWQLLQQGRDCATFFSDAQLLAAGVDAQQLQRPGYVKANQLLDGVELFDAELFGIPRREAELLDPQQRLMLECALVAVEDAGCDLDTYQGSVGVYVGAGMNTYLLHNLHRHYLQASAVEHYQLLLASDKDFLPTRISYKLNLKGPSMCINTACSTSLVAVHMACLSLLSGECDMALAGGISIRVPQLTGYQYQQGMIFSADGHCRAFDRNATGTILGDGLGLVVLKRLADALRDRDSIHAVIKGSAINNDGSAKTGYTAPSVDGQAAVIAEALAIAAVDAQSISYVEAHGTATPLGDPIEVGALTLAYRERTDAQQFCALGSVKTNIGHLDTAAGIAGLIKTTLMLRHRTLVPSLHFQAPNPQIDFAHSPFYVQTSTQAWETRGDQPLRAGVSAFGIGGTNAHVILEEAPRQSEQAGPARPELIVISASSPAQLEQATANLAQHLRKHPQLALKDVAFTQAAGRKARAARRVVVADSVREAALALVLGEQGKVLTSEAAEQDAEVILALPDISAQSGSIDSLYDSEPVFRRSYDQCLAGHAAGNAELGWFARCIAAARLFMSAGIAPAAVVGFGTGAFVAACLAEVMTLTEARDCVLSRQPSGARCFPASVQLKAASLPVLSALDAAMASSEQLQDPQFWLSQSLAGQYPQMAGGSVLLDAGLPAPPGANALGCYLDTLGKLWLQGVPVDWHGHFAERSPRKIPLPTYPFNRQRYWIDAQHAAAGPAALNASSALVREIAAAPSACERILSAHLQRQIAAIIGLSAAELPDVHASFMELGLESLTLIEIVTRLGDELGIAIAATALVEYPNIGAFCRQVAGMVAGAAPAVAQVGDVPAHADARRAALLEQRNRRRNRASGAGA